MANHIKTLRIETVLKINILKSIAHTSWGTHSKHLLQIYKALILSQIKYGSFLFHNAKHNYQQMIDTIYNADLRISIGVFKSRPCSSIYNIARVPSLQIRRLQNVITRALNNLKIMENIKDTLKKLNVSHAGMMTREYALVPP